MKDTLGDRMKRYEAVTQLNMPPRQFIIIRVDGKAFHTYTRRCEKPFDESLIRAMNYGAENTFIDIQSAKIGYVQSDEASFLLTDLTGLDAQYWFDGNVQKISSLAAAYMSVNFNQVAQPEGLGAAVFDARCFSVPSIQEAANYFLWRSHDCARNSVNQFAQAHFPHKVLHGCSVAKTKEMLLSEKKLDWDKLPDRYKYGLQILPSGTSSPIKLLDYNDWLSILSTNLELV